MQIEWQQTGNAWHDWGLCELYHILQSAELSGKVDVGTPYMHGFTMTSELPKEDLVHQITSAIISNDRWNALHPTFPEGRAIQRCAPRTENGRRIPGEKYDDKVTKEEWETHGLKGKPPSAIRNRCQRLISVTFTASQLAEIFSQNDKNGLLYKMVEAALTPNSMGDITQGINPLVGKHHSNVTVRGPGGTNGVLAGSSQEVLASVCASISAWKPFAKDDSTIILLPVGLSFPLLVKLWQHLRYTALTDPDSSDGDMYRNIPSRVEGDAANLLALLNAIQDNLAMRDANLLTMTEVRHLNKWMAIHLNSGTNIIVGAIHIFEAGANVFDLLEPIEIPSYKRNDGEVIPEKEISFMADIFSQVRVENTTWQERMAKSILLAGKNPQGAWGAMEDCAFLLSRNVKNAKTTNRWAAWHLPNCYNKFAERLTTMTTEQIAGCKKIGELTGSVFYNDITLLSRLHNTTSASDMRAILELIAFRLFKASNGTDRKGMWHLSPAEFDIIFEITHTSEWQAAAQTISAFASLKEFNINLGEENKSK